MTLNLYTDSKFGQKSIILNVNTRWETDKSFKVSKPILPSNSFEIYRILMG